MPPITPHESDAEFITPEDVENDVAFLTEALLEQEIQDFVRELVRRSDIYVQIVASGSFATQIEALANTVLALESGVDKKSEDAAKEQSVD